MNFLKQPNVSSRFLFYHFISLKFVWGIISINVSTNGIITAITPTSQRRKLRKMGRFLWVAELVSDWLMSGTHRSRWDPAAHVSSCLSTV